MKLESLCGTCCQRFLICVLIVRELNDLMRLGELNKGDKGPCELQTCLLHVLIVDGFGDFVVADPVLGRLDSPKTHGEQDGQG